MARARRHHLEDLFGEIPVTLSDVLAWMLAVPGIPPTSSRFGYYVRHYNVIAKIQDAKRSGTLDQILAAEDRPAPFRLAAAIAAGDAQRAHFSAASSRS